MEPEKGNELFKNYFLRFPDPKGKKKESICIQQLEDLQGRFLF